MTTSSPQLGTGFAGGAIQIVVPFPPGGIDLILKLLIPAWARHLGADLQIINRPGGTGVVGTLEVAQARPDGKTLLFASQGPLAYQPLVASVGYDVSTSFVPVCRVTSTPSVLMASDRNTFTCVADVVQAARKAPGKIVYSTPGPGGLPHIGMAAFAQSLGIELQHMPMAGAAAAIEALKDSQADLIAEQLPTAMALAGKGARIIGVFAPERQSVLPDTPTVTEQGCNLSFQSWNLLMAPAGTPDAVLAPVRQACADAMTEVSAQLHQQMGLAPGYLGAEATAAFIEEEMVRAKALARRSGLAPAQ